MRNQANLEATPLTSGGGQKKFSIVFTVRDAMVCVWRYRGVIFLRLSIPMLLFVLIWTLASRMPPEAPDAIKLLFVGLEFMLFSLFSVACLQVFLQGSNVAPRFGVMRWGRRESRFLLALIALYIVITLTAVALTTVAGVIATNFVLLEVETLRWLFYLSLIPTLYILARLFLLLPAAAIGNRLKPAEAWHLTNGNGWRLAVVLGGFPWLLVVVRDQALPPNGPPVAFAAYGLLGVILMVFEYAALAVCYRTLIKDQHGTSDE